MKQQSKKKQNSNTRIKHSRRHPDNSELFWCSKCLKYKKKKDFHKHNEMNYGISGICKKCSAKVDKESLRKRIEKNPNYYSDIYAKLKKENPNYSKDKHKRDLELNPQLTEERRKKHVENLSDSYIKNILVKQKNKTPITKKAIETKRREMVAWRISVKLRKLMKKDRQMVRTVRQHPNNPNLLWCGACLKYIEAEKFNNDSSKKDGKTSQCKKCSILKTKKRDAKRLADNPNYYKEREKKKLAKNPNYYKEREEKRLAGNPNYYKEIDAKRLAKNPNYYKEKRERFKAKNPGYAKAAYEKLIKNNPDYLKTLYAKKLARNPNYYKEKEAKRLAKNPNYYREREERKLAKNPNYYREKYLRNLAKNPNYYREKETRKIAENPNYYKDRNLKRLEKDPDYYKKLRKKRLDKDPDCRKKEYQKSKMKNPYFGRDIYRKRSADLTDTYVRILIKGRKANIPLTNEIIEIVRQQLIAKRTLKEFRRWRKDNEPGSQNVSG